MYRILLPLLVVIAATSFADGDLFAQSNVRQLRERAQERQPAQIRNYYNTPYYGPGVSRDPYERNRARRDAYYQERYQRRHSDRYWEEERPDRGKHERERPRSLSDQVKMDKQSRREQDLRQRDTIRRESRWYY